MVEAHKETTVVIANSESQSVFNCIDSVDGKANVVVSLTPSDAIESKLNRLSIPYVVVPRGNLGLTFNAGIDLAKTDKVIIMTDDATFNDGAVDMLSEGLEHFDACKAKIVFAHDETKPLTRWVADVRDFINSSPTRVFTPGLAINKHIKDSMGGRYFDERVRWAEDAEFSYRFHQNNLAFGYFPEATINHPPVLPLHDLRGAFLMGVSKRRSVDLGLRQGDEDLLPTLQRLISGKSFERKIGVLQEKGPGALVYMMVWDIAYNTGYNLRKMHASGPLEENVWVHFGRDEHTVAK